MFTSAQNLVIESQPSTKSYMFLSRAQKQHSTRKLWFFFPPKVSWIIIDHCFQQIVWQKLKPWVMLWDQGGDQPSKIWEKLDFSSNSAWFLRSLVSTIWREAKESNLQRSERPIGSRAVKCWHTAMRDLHVFCVRFSHGSVLFDVLFSHGRALFDLRNVQKRATKSDTSGYCLCNWSIWCQGKSPTIGCMMAHLKTQPVRGEQTEQNSRWGGGNLDCSVHSAQFLVFTR